MSEIKGCMNCGNISCGNNKKRESAGCGRYISPEDKIKVLSEFANLDGAINIPMDKVISLRVKAEQFISEVEK